MDEPTELDCFCRIVVESREVDGGVQGQGAVALDGICSGIVALVLISYPLDRPTHLSVMNRSQYSLLRLELSIRSPWL